MKIAPALVASLLFMPPTALRAADVAAAKPNIVIFIADDLSWFDVACFGGPTGARTPHLDRLAKEGLKLTGFFSPASVCSPTRQSLLTGLYPVRSGAYPNHSQVRPGTKSLPHFLRALGYRSACVGKTHFGPAASFPFDTMLPMRGEKPGGKGGDDGDGELDTTGMEQFIRRDASKPFLFYIATHEPHGPWTKGDESVYDPAKLTLDPTLPDTPATREALAAYYAEVTHMDKQVGGVLRMLEETGHTKDTLFLFFSEQGSSGPQGKWTCYDPAIRVAAIARWPGRITPGTQNAALVQYVDILPTLIGAAGGEAPASPAEIDGRGFIDVLDGKSGHHRDYVFAQHTGRGIINGPDAYGTRAVRDQRWKLIVNLHPDAEFRNALTKTPVFRSWLRKAGEGDEFALTQTARYTRRPAVELYDLQADPWEMNNVAAKPEHAEVVTRLRTQLDSWMRQQGDEGDKTEREAHEHQARARAGKKTKGE